MNARTLSLLLLGALVGGVGCLDDRAQTSVQMAQICSATDDCTFAATCDQQHIGSVIIDVSLTNELVLFLQMNNQLQNNADLASGRVNTNNAHLTQVTVEYDGVALPSGGSSPPANIQIPANGSTTAGVVAVHAAAGNALALLPALPVEFTARIKGHGYFDNGRTFETGEYPVRMVACDGCLGVIACTPPALPQACPGFGQTPAAQTCVTP